MLAYPTQQQHIISICIHRFSYTAIVPPSFCVEDENETGLTLAYRSRRKGFVYYVVGQLKDVAKRFYDLEIGVDVIHIQVLKWPLLLFIFRFVNSFYKGPAYKG